jgi:hypothetical protein
MRLVIMACVACAACSGPSIVVMRNPQTAEIVQCRPATEGASFFPIFQAVLNSGQTAGCANGYAAAGWQRMN